MRIATGLCLVLALTFSATHNRVSAYAQGVGSKVVDGSQPKSAPWPDDLVYSNFANLLTLDHNMVQKEIREAKPGSPQIVEGRAQWLAIGITPDQFHFVLDNAVLTHYRLSANQDQTRAEIQTWRQKYGGDMRKAAADGPDPEFTRLQREWGEIVQQFIVTLKQGLGDEAFARLDAWIRRDFGNGKVTGFYLKTQTPAVSR